jgi:hypothetical protein
MLEPTVSLNLAEHIVGPRGKQTKPEHASQFHVIEIKRNHGFKSAFQNKSQNKV